MPDSHIDSQPSSAQRQKALAARRQMNDAARYYASLRITEQIVRASFFRRSLLIGCYLPTDDEVDTWPVVLRAWRMKKRIFAPIVAQRGKMTFREVSANCDLVHNNYGIPEPINGDEIDPRRLDIVLTPLVAFDTNRHRIGMGGGYFDRAFSFLRIRSSHIRPKLIGLAFECQKVEKISPNPWDIPVFQVITEAGST